MIGSIRAQNIKGMSFEYQLGQKTFIAGPNGAGKTSILIALQLAINGEVPGTGKRNQDILHNFGSHDQLSAGISNGTRLDRHWKRSKGDSVSQVYMVDTRKVGKDRFITDLAKSGSPKLFDVTAFIKLSDQKKIDMIFDLFPPAGDIGKLTIEIEGLNEKLKLKQKKIRDKENFISECTVSKASLELPAGTLAETSAEKDRLKLSLSEAQNNLKKAEIAIAEQEAADKAKEEAEAKAKETPSEPTQDRIHVGIPPKIRGSQSQRSPHGEFNSGTSSGIIQHLSEGHAVLRPAEKTTTGPIVEADAALASLNAVLTSMKNTGCETCVAMMVLKREIQKYES